MRNMVGAIACAIALALTFNAAFAWATGDAPSIRARVRCTAPAEDSLAHVRMVRYDVRNDGTYVVVYRCMRNGY